MFLGKWSQIGCNSIQIFHVRWVDALKTTTLILQKVNWRKLRKPHWRCRNEWNTYLNLHEHNNLFSTINKIRDFMIIKRLLEYQIQFLKLLQVSTHRKAFYSCKICRDNNSFTTPCVLFPKFVLIMVYLSLVNILQKSEISAQCWCKS